MNHQIFTWEGYTFEVGQPHPFCYYESDGVLKSITEVAGVVTFTFARGYSFKIDKNRKKIPL